MLEVTGISVSYGAHRALENASVQVDGGEIVVILGANGAGKSSLLKAIAGTCEGQVEGTVELDGAHLSSFPAEEIVVRGIAFVPENRGIFGDLTVKDNLLLGAYSQQAREHQESNFAHVQKLFPKLREREKQIARTMSGGEQQMVAIGRAMMANPKILMLDEPSLGLSPLLCKELFQNLARIRDTGIGVLMVEQNAKQSLAIADRAYLLENGSIIGENSAKAMMNDPAVQAAYLGGAQGASIPAKTISIEPIAATAGGHRDAAIAAASALKFLKPSHADHVVGSSSQFAGVDIGSLVARAADLAQPKTNTTSTLSTKTGTTTTSKAHENPSAVKLSTNSLPGDNSDVRRLLADFETAAQRALGGDTTRSLSSSNAKSSTPTRPERSEILPQIPVYRKSKLEIYRRTAGGDLIKVEEK